MAESLFDKLQSEAFRKGIRARTAESMKWFRNRMQDFSSINRQKLLKDPRLARRQRFGAGNLYMFYYDPKHRETLPYYDAFPLAIMVGPAPKGFYGLNVHYLPPVLRARLFDRLLSITNNKRFDESTKFEISYEVLTSVSSLSLFQPCFKHYLSAHVDSQIMMVESGDWETAMFLPTEAFKKRGTRKVWADSRKLI